MVQREEEVCGPTLTASSVPTSCGASAACCTRISNGTCTHANRELDAAVAWPCRASRRHLSLIYYPMTAAESRVELVDRRVVQRS